MAFAGCAWSTAGVHLSRRSLSTAIVVEIAVNRLVDDLHRRVLSGVDPVARQHVGKRWLLLPGEWCACTSVPLRCTCACTPHSGDMSTPAPADAQSQGFRFTLNSAAEATGLSKRTLLRKLDVLEAHGAEKTPEGNWSIPLGALFAIGANPGAPRTPTSDTDAPVPAPAEMRPAPAAAPLDGIGESTWQDRAIEAEKRAEVAEAVLAERDRVLIERAEHIASLQHAMRALPAATSAQTDEVARLREQVTSLQAESFAAENRVRSADRRVREAEALAYASPPNWTQPALIAAVVLVLVLGVLVIWLSVAR